MELVVEDNRYDQIEGLAEFLSELDPVVVNYTCAAHGFHPL